MDSQSTTTQAVIDHYSSVARERGAQGIAYSNKVAQSFGYSLEDLAAIPDGANMGLSCGNPLALAGLKAGETVIDLGCGGGFDVFQAARKIGADGLAIGIDMSTDMLERAQKNTEKMSIKNVKFVHAPITDIPLDPESVDCAISNCVINLLPQTEKLVCFREVFRLLKPGGRLTVSDILAKKPFPKELQEDIALYVGCISGASLVSEYKEWLNEAGFHDVVIVDKKADLNVYKTTEPEGEEGSSCWPTTKSTSEAPASSCCSTATDSDGPTKQARLSDRVANIDFNEWASSYSIYAIKPNVA